MNAMVKLQVEQKPARKQPMALAQVDLFKGRYKIETVKSTFSCAKQTDLKATLEGLNIQDSLIAYVFNELYAKGICELKYKAITITDCEWVKSKGVYNPANEVH